MTGSAKRSLGAATPHSASGFRRLASFIVAEFLWLCVRTWRLRWKDTPIGPEAKRPVIYCAWHNRIPIAMACYIFSRDRWADNGLAAMISASRDGGFLAGIAKRFGMEAIRGSSSRRGSQALLEATTWLERNHSVALTPDGPRGPKYVVQDGITQLAKVSGRPIIPVSSFTHWKIRLKSWDRMQIPLPFTRCDLNYGEPIWVPRDASESQLEELRAHLERTMHALTHD